MREVREERSVSVPLIIQSSLRQERNAAYAAKCVELRPLLRISRNDNIPALIVFIILLQQDFRLP